MDDALAGFSNLSERPPGFGRRLLDFALPGVREVAAQREPYARAWEEANRAALATDDGPLWVALGDSMTQGLGASDPQHGWVGQAQEALAAAGRPYRVVNLSMSGGLTADVLERQLPMLERVHADLVTLLVGANDALHPRRRAALPETFGRVLDRLPRGAIVARMPQMLRVGKRVNALIDDEVRSGRIRAVTAQTALRGQSARDRFHPNDAGYAVIAEGFVDAVLRE